MFSGDYLETTKSPESAERFYRDEYLKRFFDENWNLLPEQPSDAMDERMFAKLARLYEKSARIEDAIFICRLAVKHIRRVPQCAGILGDLLLEAGEYEETIKIADRSIQGDARDQSHVNISAQFMKKGNAHDALFFALAHREDAAKEKLYHARQAFIAYSRCLTSGDTIPGYDFQLRSRSNSIVAMLETIGVPAAEIREMLPPNIRSMAGVAPTESGDALDSETTATGETAINDFLIRAKKISVSPENTWPDQIEDMAADVAESGLAVAAATIFQNAANHFDDDHEEVQFVKVLRLLAKRLGGGDSE